MAEQEITQMQVQLDEYVKAYDKIGKFLETETDPHKQRMAMAHRKHVLDQMVALQMRIKFPLAG